MKYIHVSQTNSYSVWNLLFFLFWIQILRSKNKIYSYWHTTVRQNNMIWEGICVVFFTWNILILSYINKIEAVTLKHIKKKKFNQSSFSTSTKNPPKKQKQKKTHKKINWVTESANTYDLFTDTLDINFCFLFSKQFFNFVIKKLVQSHWLKRNNFLNYQ